MSEIESIKREMKCIKNEMNNKRVRIDELMFEINELDNEWRVLSDNLDLAMGCESE